MTDYSKVDVQLVYSPNSDYSPDLLQHEETQTHEQRPTGRVVKDVFMSSTNVTANLNLSEFSAVDYVYVQNRGPEDTIAVRVSWRDSYTATDNGSNLLAGDQLLIPRPNPSVSIVLSFNGLESPTDLCKIKLIAFGTLAV